jgi:hypothetical protein
MSVILKLFKSLALVFMVLVIVMFAINWSDQAPSPATVEMESLLKQGSEIPDEENGFVFAVGLSAPQGSDPVRSGAECIAKLNAAIQKETINFKTDLDCWAHSSFEGENSTISNIFNACGLPLQGKDCEKALQKNEQAIAHLLEEKSWFFKGYLELLQRNKWHPTTEFSIYMPLPYYSPLGKGQQMLLLKAWHLAGEGKVEELRKLLNKDAQFWRVVMSSSSMLIDKMLATAFLTRHFAISNLVLRRLQQNGVQILVPDAWLVPFNGDELSIKKAMAGEWAFTRTVLKETIDPRTFFIWDGYDSSVEERTIIDEWLLEITSHFLLPQATQNEYAEKLLQLVEILDVPIDQFPSALQREDAFVKEFNLYSLYNPIGHILVGVGMPSYSGFAERVYNLEGARRAALVTARLREKGVRVNQVDSALSKSDITNPFNAKPFTWNAETKSIVFKGLGTEKRSTHSFLY